MFTNRTLWSFALALLLGACGGEASTGANNPSDDIEDTGPPRSSDTAPLQTDSSTVPSDSTEVVPHCEAGQVSLTMSVDDSANQTYEEGELLWTGSFAFDVTTNTIAYATAWQPTDGPYPPLWDDGPISSGGHEAEGHIAGDHIFSVAVCYAPEQDRLISYGVLNEDMRWIWQGPNGLLNVPIDASGQLNAEGLVIPAHGDRDIEVTVDLAALHPDYASISLDSHAVYLKGSMNSWTPVQLLDNGKLGDAVAGDGVLTYRHSAYAHGHIGLLRPGQEAQFVFVFALGELDPDLAAEYKVAGEAASDGTSARMHCLDGWVDADIVQSLDSKGLSLNTALTVCPDDADIPLTEPDAAECGADLPCPVGFICEAAACIPADDVNCDEETPCGDGESCMDGECEPSTEDPCDIVNCDDDEVCVDGDCITPSDDECGPETQCSEPNAVCVEGVCSVPTSSPELVLIIPATGSELGGSTVSLQGSGFEEGVTVTFGDADAELISFSPSELFVITPPHPLGSTDVTVTHIDGASSTYPGGFTYVTAGSAPEVTSVTPANGPSSGGTQVTVQGANFAVGAVVRFGTATASETIVAPDGASLSTTSPEAPLGVVPLTVVNPDGQEATLSDAFTYSPNVPDWGRLNPPTSVAALAEVQTITLSAEVYEATVTEGAGPGFGIVAEVGYGPLGSLPGDSDDWTWSPATFSSDADNNDVWEGSFTAPEGSWSATMRFSLGVSAYWLFVDRDGTDNGLQADQLVTLDLSAAPPVAVTAITPETSWLPGGGNVILEGIGLAESCTLSMDDVVLTTSWDAPNLTFVAPAQPAGDATLVLSCPEGTAEITLSYVESWDGLLNEWPEASLLATNTLPSSWGDDNTLQGLYVAADDTHLYVAVEGQCYAADGFNAIVVYIDVDLGDSTGVTQTASLTDSNHAVDAVLGGILEFTAPGFGAEVAVTSLNMSGYDPLFADPIDATAGWRALAPADDFPWLINGAVYGSPSSVEARIPLEALLGPPTGATHQLGFITRLTNGTGDYTADQALPEGVSGDAYELAPEAASFSLTY
ncbi:MAG: IPT/TIG domain-containing protein [Myxococcota bacterium]